MAGEIDRCLPNLVWLCRGKFDTVQGFESMGNFADGNDQQCGITVGFTFCALAIIYLSL